MKFYLIGIKGNGMSSLALLLFQDGYVVEGEDTENFIQTETKLIENNIKIYEFDTYKKIDADVFIVGHTFENIITQNYDKLMIPYNKFLAFYLNSKNQIAVCGSHGKTSMVGLLSTLLNASFLRGDGDSYLNKNSDYFVLEACEYQNHFLAYGPEQIILLNVDFDHADYFKNYDDYLNSFKTFLSKSKINYIPYSLIDIFPNSITIGSNINADFSYQNIEIVDGNLEFDIYEKNVFSININTTLKGFQFVEMITFCYAFSRYNNLDFDIDKINEFKLARRRFNIIDFDNNVVIIDDYAHHPTQIKMHCKNLQYLYKNYYHIGIFEPDRYSRLKTFIDEFNEVLTYFDVIYILPLPNMKENIGKTERIFSLKNIKYIKSINEVEIIKDRKVVYSFMSSKEMKENIDDLIKNIKK